MPQFSVPTEASGLAPAAEFSAGLPRREELRSAAALMRRAPPSPVPRPSRRTSGSSMPNALDDGAARAFHAVESGAPNPIRFRPCPITFRGFRRGASSTPTRPAQVHSNLHADGPASYERRASVEFAKRTEPETALL